MADDIIPIRHSYALSMVERITELEAEIERLRDEREDHKARLAVEAVTAPDADYDTMMDSLQARLSDLHADIERLRAAGDALIEAMDTGSWAQDVVPAIAAWLEARRG